VLYFLARKIYHQFLLWFTSTLFEYRIESIIGFSATLRVPIEVSGVTTAEMKPVKTGEKV
jgi:hypothetical protein